MIPDITQLIKNLSDPDESERLFAADDLGASNLEAAVRPLSERLVIEPQRVVREMIVLSLSKIESDAVMKQAVALLQTEDPFIRNEMSSLLQSKGSAAIPWLREALKSSDADVRKLALDAAWEIPDDAVEDLLKVGLADAEENVVMAAIEYSGLRRAVRLRAEIEAIARSSPPPMTALACIEALTTLGDENSLEVLIQCFGERTDLRSPMAEAKKVLGEHSLAKE